MKKSIAAILCFSIINWANAQDSIIGKTPESVIGVVREVSDLFNVEMRRDGNPFSRQNIKYTDSLEFYNVEIRSIIEKKHEGTTITYGEPKVNQILIRVPQNQILKLYEHFKNAYKNKPGYRTGGQYIQFENVNIYWQEDSERNNDVPMAYLYFEKK